MTDTKRRFDVWLFYPMPARDELDEKLRKLAGWYGSGFTEEERDNSVKASFIELATILALCPEDGYVKVTNIKETEAA